MNFFSDTNVSAGELQELLNLIPWDRPPLPRLSGLLQPLREVLAPKWVRDFLFTPSPIHIPLLLAPTLPITSLTCHSTSTTIEKDSIIPVLPSRQNDYYHFNGYMLLASAFTANDTTVGVGIWHAVSKGAPYCRSAPSLRRLNLRFARDAKTRTLVIVLDCAEEKLYHITTARIETTTSFRVMNGFFSRSLQDIALREERELLLQHISSTVLLAQDEHQYRTCSMCGALPQKESCGCELPFETPAHPYDSDYFLRSMSHHIGSSAHVANRMEFAHCKPQKQSVLGCRVTFDGILNAEVIQMMSNWSLTEHAKTITQDPLQSILFNKNDSEIPYPANWETTRRLLLDTADSDPRGLGGDENVTWNESEQRKHTGELNWTGSGDGESTTAPLYSQKSTVVSYDSATYSYEKGLMGTLSSNGGGGPYCMAGEGMGTGLEDMNSCTQAMNDRQYEQQYEQQLLELLGSYEKGSAGGIGEDLLRQIYSDGGRASGGGGAVASDNERIRTLQTELEAYREIAHGLQRRELELREVNSNLRRFLVGKGNDVRGRWS